MTADDADPQTRWDERWTSRSGVPGAPASFVVASAAHLPSAGGAIDVAGGAGRHALWLARRGLEVILVDVSRVALNRAEAAARAEGLNVTTLRRDLESEGMPPGRWDVVLIYYFLDRDVFTEVPRALEPGGIFVFCQPTVRNRERHERPAPEYLLEEGELAGMVASLPLEALLLEEGWGPEGRHEARLIARLAPHRRAT